MYSKQYIYSRDLDYLLSEYQKYYKKAKKHPTKWRELINILEGQIKVIEALKYAYKDLGLYLEPAEENFDIEEVAKEQTKLYEFCQWVRDAKKQTELCHNELFTSFFGIIITKLRELGIYNE